jgi:hypothetical protein
MYQTYENKFYYFIVIFLTVLSNNYYLILLQIYEPKNMKQR